MSTRQLVLVAMDHATDVERTMDVALDAATARNADVHVIQVLPHRSVRVDDRTGPSVREPYDARTAAIGARLASMSRSAGHDGVHVRRVTLWGQPELVVPAYAQLHQAALLVVERNYGSSRVWRHGRVVEELTHKSPIPVLVLPERQGGERRQPGLRRILAPVDSSIASAVALRTAVDLSRRHGARVTLLHALKDVPRHMVFGGSEVWELMRRLPARVEAVAERLRRKAAFYGADDVDTEVATGAAGGAIREAATRFGADLIVMGVAHRSWLNRLLFGSTLRGVVRRATVPVLAVPVIAGAQVGPDNSSF